MRRTTGTAVVLLALLMAVGCVTPPDPGPAVPTGIAGETADVLFFWGESCHACHQVSPFLDEVAADHPGIRIERIEIHGNPANTTRYHDVNRALNVTPRGLPEAVAGGRAFFGAAAIREGLPAAVEAIEAGRRA
ncbi:MAG: thioredoxin family protein [Methanospirillum sp.]|nr:thioredoxin family protein [Methanospirillum sp.]